MVVQPGLCGTWSETPKTGFLRTRPIWRNKQTYLLSLFNIFQQQVEQMREMGITDENVARQALMATNGDLQAAIDLIFSGDM